MSMGESPSAHDAPRLEELLARHRPALVRFLERKAGGLMRFEDAEDLAQGVHMHALAVADRFEYRGEAAFVGWLHAVALRYVADRNAWWKAQKRDAGPLLRLSLASAGDAGVGDAFFLAYTGPQTFAQRREHLAAAAKALAALPERDRALLELDARGLDIDQLAEALGMGYDAAQRARLRARERFRKLFQLAVEQEPS